MRMTSDSSSPRALVRSPAIEIPPGTTLQQVEPDQFRKELWPTPRSCRAGHSRCVLLAVHHVEKTGNCRDSSEYQANPGLAQSVDPSVSAEEVEQRGQCGEEANPLC